MLRSAWKGWKTLTKFEGHFSVPMPGKPSHPNGNWPWPEEKGRTSEAFEQATEELEKTEPSE